MRVHIGNLSALTTEEALRRLFGAEGEVTTVRFVTDSYVGRSRGFAYVEMPNIPEGVRAVKALNGREVDGRALVVTDEPERPPRPHNDRPRPASRRNRTP